MVQRQDVQLSSYMTAVLDLAYQSFLPLSHIAVTASKAFINCAVASSGSATHC